MPTNTTVLIILVIFNLLTINYAYRIYRNNESIQPVFGSYEPSANLQERLANLNNLKQETENNFDKNYYIICQPKSTHILCSQLNNISRRDTGFLRFGRKR
ncbi:unnamed protein product [Rotaria socialis]|uniref:Uncharacterized protein n=1 Tax=Rotaria socialis TaxID=392032 RepID=A0A818CXU3_9BILA|nr:unnamed protein product [Rotaria socialis]CAF3446668.1 unnamed protein product [Rotaria socialis]CAF3524610.1 unnamed protein product [Rotaria socialis]CAF4245969.1 unnamed protein product [Rotaria socialis]CAF4260806.1 unnamed protein product [Rotaria socialis]